MLTQKIKWHDFCKIQRNCFFEKKKKKTTKKKKNNNNKKAKQKNKNKKNKKNNNNKKKKQQQQQQKTEHFSKCINIKIEMNLCSGKTAKLKDLFPTERDCGLNAQLYSEFSNFF